MVPYTCSSVLGKLRQENFKFKAGLIYPVETLHLPRVGHAQHELTAARKRTP